MLKKMTLLAMALGALLAFVVPAAQGQELYEEVEEVHVPLEVGAEVAAKSTNLTTIWTYTGFFKFNIECANTTVHGTVTVNEATTVHIKSEFVTVEGCSIVISNPIVGSITINGNTTGRAHDATFRAGPVCHFNGDIPFTYEHDTDMLTVTGIQQFFVTPEACGQTHMTVGSFTLETGDGTPVFIE
jgi:hypothetical protein